MTPVFALALQGMQEDMARVDRVSMNLANATTPGYKRAISLARPLDAAFAQALDAAASRPAPSAGEPPASVSTAFATDRRPGTLKTTGQSLDVALEGPGYFEVLTDAGPAYTRRGDWHLDARGRLLSAQGYPVMGQGGEIVSNDPHPRIDASGRIFEARPDGRPDPVALAQLKVVDFEHPEDARPDGDGLVRAGRPPVPVSEAELRVRQGFLENANVSSLREMTQLVATLRHFESMQKVLLVHDEMLGSALRRLGELS